MTDLTGKTAFVTGAGSGQGFATALALAEAGARVVGVDVNEAGLAELATQNSDIVTTRCDVTDYASVQAAIALTIEKFGGLHAVLNCAGILRTAPFEEITDADFDLQFNVNVRGVFNVCKAALPELKRAGGGSIVNWGSANSFVAEPDSAAYCASKGAVLMLTKAVAIEYGKFDVRANCLCPAAVNTPMVADFFEEDFLTDKEKQREYQPLGMAVPRDIADVAVFLASDASRFMTGSAVMVDGGYTAL